MAPKDFNPAAFATKDICDYTKHMGEADGKSIANSLFEHLPELPDENHLPDTAPLTPQQRHEAVKWLLSPEGGNVQVRLFKPYNDPNIKNLVIESMLVNAWFLPNTALGNEIPLQAQSAHKVGSGTIPITIPGESPMKVDVVAKPFRAKNSKAEDELEKLEKIRERNIATVDPLGVIDINDGLGHDTYILTILKKGILPVQKINFEQLFTGHGDDYSQLKYFLNDLAVFTAKMHDNGIVHGDLHIGNIALDMNQSAKDKFVVFDLEGGTIMASQDLGVKNQIQTSPPESKLRKFKLFEMRAIGDIANLAADIAAKNELLSYDTILFNLVAPYFKARRKSHGRLTENDQNDQLVVFSNEYKKRHRRTMAIIKSKRKRLIELDAKEVRPAD